MKLIYIVVDDNTNKIKHCSDCYEIAKGFLDYIQEGTIIVKELIEKEIDDIEDDDVEEDDIIVSLDEINEKEMDKTFKTQMNTMKKM